MAVQIIFGAILIGLLIAHAYMRPVVEMDRKNDQMIIHYWWRGTRRTYVLK